MKNNNNENDKNKIIGINNIDIITNGKPCDYSNIEDVNKVGKVIIKDTQEELSEITPLIMVINQSAINCNDKVNALIRLGADPDMKINFYGKVMSARDCANSYRPNIVL